ncbi:hypothetical protein NQ314_014656 [Rhamnusium bicolor]|uniref:Uncharacterized protein n=1 Tax=Rhamnusium bicolor TaxID=1586634 RepID=A0AAV8X217_9CUCU|nr:hypothetical protein NQ314_014656 [Rhamnusium bicolor]
MKDAMEYLKTDEGVCLNIGNIPPLNVDDEMEPDYGININGEAENLNENVNEDLLAARQLQQQLINNYFNN